MSTWYLVRKLLRDIRIAWLITALLLFLFQLLWARVTHRIVVDLLAGFRNLGVSIDALRQMIFAGPGQIIQTLMGGESIRIERPTDLLSIGYVHPTVQIILCIWAVGRAAGAIAGEIERGTMELLLGQPIRRYQLIVAHGIVDAITIPTLALVLWLGTAVGAWFVGLVSTDDPQLHVDLWRFFPAAINVGLFVFAVSGVTLWISSMGRLRWRVLGIVILIFLVQFLVNVIGQLWPPLEPLRPFTLFYHYHPQALILSDHPWSHANTWLRLGVLTSCGMVGYGLATWCFCRRDLPAPL